MKTKTWLAGWLIIVITALTICGYWVHRIDPFFHYHKPDTESYYYPLNAPRYQNNGITRYFDYDAIVTGSSMTQNFHTSEVDELFECHSIKVSYDGATYKEINDNLKVAFDNNPNISLIIRGLDDQLFTDTWDRMEYACPEYMYDKNPFNDVEYLWNRDVIFERVYQMRKDRKSEDFVPGITAFDDYLYWQEGKTYGINSVGALPYTNPESNPHLTDEDKEQIKLNIERNITDLADEHPDVDFYYFYTPYSIENWMYFAQLEKLNKVLEAEAYVTELILPHKNIHLFAFGNRTDIITDLNNYADYAHYAGWINSLMLKWMHDGQYQLTEDNYREYLKDEYSFIANFDPDTIADQPDYEADYYAGALLNHELTGAQPLAIDTSSYTVDLTDGYNYLGFYVQKVTPDNSFAVNIYDGNNQLVMTKEVSAEELDDNKHQYVLNLSKLCGEVRIEFEGSCEYSDKYLY